MLKHLTAQRLKEAQSSLQVLAKTSPKALSTHVLIETGINQPRTRAGRDPRLHSDRLWRNSVWTSRSLQLDRNSLFNPALFLQYRLLALVAHIKKHLSVSPAFLYLSWEHLAPYLVSSLRISCPRLSHPFLPSVFLTLFSSSQVFPRVACDGRRGRRRESFISLPERQGGSDRWERDCFSKDYLFICFSGKISLLFNRVKSKIPPF